LPVRPHAAEGSGEFLREDLIEILR